MKYKVGDKVRVRKDILTDKIYGHWVFVEGMRHLIGGVVSINRVLDGCYRIYEDSHFVTDEMLEDVEEGFKLPEKWCIKQCSELRKWGKTTANRPDKDFDSDRSYYWPVDESLVNWNFGSKGVREEITFDQFKKYVLKNLNPIPVKEDVKFEVGKWYKYSAEYINRKTYAKYSSNQRVGGRFYYDEIITENNGFKKGHNWSILTCNPVLLTDLSEIQQYLPENHPDKIKKRSKKVEDLRYPDVVHCNSQKERNLLKNHVPKFDINNWTSEDPYLLIGGGCCSHPYEENTWNNYVNYEFYDIIFPEEKVVYKEDEEFKVGAYIVFIDSFGGSKKGDIDKICRVDSPEQIRLVKEGLCWGRLGEGFDKKCKYFPTIKEAQEFSDELLGKNKVETKSKLSKEELLKEAKRRYPVGTKYKCANGISAPYAEECFEITHGDELKFFDDSKQKIDAIGRGFVYCNGNWAEMVSGPTVEEEVIDVPEYIECIEGYSNYIIPGLIYKVIDKTHVNSIILRCNITSNLSAGSNLYVSVWSFAFKPSTKEAFEKQSKSSVKEKEELVQTGLSQSQACDSCKYHGEECAKRKGCDATGGQHYPKGYISPPLPLPSRLEGSDWDLERSLISTEFTRLMGDICGIPSTSNDCFGPDEIYVPIIKTEVKQIKL